MAARGEVLMAAVRLCAGEVAAKPADDHAGGVGVGPAGLAGRVRESVAGAPKLGRH